MMRHSFSESAKMLSLSVTEESGHLCHPSAVLRTYSSRSAVVAIFIFSFLFCACFLDRKMSYKQTGEDKSMKLRFNRWRNERCGVKVRKMGLKWDYKIVASIQTFLLDTDLLAYCELMTATHFVQLLLNGSCFIFSIRSSDLLG